MIKRIFQTLIIATPFLIFGRLLWLDITPAGQRVIRVEANQVSPFVDRILPDNRVLGLQINQQGESFETILKDPVYFSIHQPSTNFETLEVELEYQTDAPILEVGPLVDVYASAYDLRPLQNSIIDNSDWQRVEQGGLVLLSRNGDADNIDGWLSNLPARSKIATYHYDLATPYRIADYRPLGSAQTFEVALRGYHKYLTYVKNEEFHLEVTYWDMNRTLGADEGVIRVINEYGDVMAESAFEDDDDTREDQFPSHQTQKIDGYGWPEGVYSVELKGTSDIFWRQIKTSQRYLTFVNKMYFGDEIGYLEKTRPVTFFTNAKRLTLETYHADATQRVQVGSQAILIPHSHEKVKRTITDRGVDLGGRRIIQKKGLDLVRQDAVRVAHRAQHVVDGGGVAFFESFRQIHIVLLLRISTACLHLNAKAQRDAKVAKERREVNGTDSGEAGSNTEADCFRLPNQPPINRRLLRNEWRHAAYPDSRTESSG